MIIEILVDISCVRNLLK